MCDCISQVRHNLKAISDATEIIMPIELLTGKVYIEVEKVYIEKGKTKRKMMPVTLARCPFCGIEYDARSSGDTMGQAQ